MAEKSTFHETKEITTRLHEPYKVKIVPYKTQKESGHSIEVQLNLSWEQIDGMAEKDSDIINMIENCKKLIEGPLESKYLSVINDENI